eukprot:CAMPEP_0197515102 /NCGR_PEP_ID=MMETSP1318-20131121/335_1 /TAXON_ID=552666 /ORGANISM="Partenskyella glossopodia, Strain RCC365" /LENGTH=583 /DNA_ID=CAMNT_0043063379 /DNA_START=47 /DNA_END=1798 /DNA_ORIENTATION=+
MEYAAFPARRSRTSRLGVLTAASALGLVAFAAVRSTYVSLSLGGAVGQRPATTAAKVSQFSMRSAVVPSPLAFGRTMAQNAPVNDMPWRSAYLRGSPLSARGMSVGATGGAHAGATGNYEYDLFVIGAGSGGVRASRISAGHGAKVAVADDLDVGLGGTCVNVGCVPKKLFAYGSEITTEVKDAAGFGWDFASPDLQWSRLIENKDKEINRLNGIYERMLTNSGVDVIKGRATLVDPHTVAVGDKTYSAEKILVAVGGWPVIPDIPGKEHVITSNEIFYLKEMPKKAVILGSGYIAVEFAGILHGYGSNVDLIIRRDSILRGFDKDCSDYLRDAMIGQGINIHKGTEATAIEKRGENDYLVTLKDGTVLEADCILAAIGRNPKTTNIGLENVGIEIGKNGGIAVKKDGQTNIPSIYAVGDCTDTLQLTPVALAEGHCFADTQFGNNPRTADLEDVATAVFSHPNLGTVGLPEDAALEKYGKIKVYKSEFRPLKHTVSGSTERSFMKIIVDSASDRVVGMHMVGAHAGEMMQGFAAAIKMRITKKQLDSVIGIHPTSAEEFVTMRTASYETEKASQGVPQPAMA